MAHKPPLDPCAPQRVFGTFEQTQFLGLSVLSFTANAGINEQSSEVTVELVKDACAGLRKFTKTSSVPFVHTSVPAPGVVDPGFTEPDVGAPCYFRVADFEYSGILQSWTKKNGADGNPIYTVKLVDPRILLDNVQIILSEYQGSLQGLSNPREPVGARGPQYQLVNIVNPYGFLDSLIQNCTFVDSAGNVPAPGGASNPDDPIYFGAPAGGWGIASGRQDGLPWTYLKRALQVLLGYGSPQGDSNGDLPNGDPEMASKFSKGYISGPPGTMGPPFANGLGYGEIFTSGGLGTLASPAKYILDLSEIPDAPLHYRVSGPIITASELISQVCRDAGCDYYIELLPSTGGHLIIKVRVILRTNQPAMGQITGFINLASNSDGVTSNTLGKEYRPDPNNAFIIGDKRRGIYSHSGTGHFRDQSIQPYWGRDLDGKLNLSYQSTGCEITDPSNPLHWLGPSDWNVRLDFREINGLLTHDLYATHMTGRSKLSPDLKGWVWEGELRAALGDFKSFINFLLMDEPYCKPTSPPGDATFLKRWSQDLLLGYQGMVTLPPIVIGVPGASLLPQKFPAKEAFLSSINVQVGTTGPKGRGSSFLRDAQKMHKWLQQFAQEHYGRKWLVEVPFTCWAGDTGNPNLLSWTDEPSTEGGWSDSSRLIELQNRDSVGNNWNLSETAMDRFRTEDGRILPILRWTQNGPPAVFPWTRNPSITGLDYDRVPLENMYTDTFNKNVPAQHADMYVWQKCEIDDMWVTGSPYSGSYQKRAFALLTCDPITTGFPSNEGVRAPESIIVKSGLRDRMRVYAETPMVGVAGTFGSRMISPLAAAIPVLSNTQTYGPWFKQANMANANDSYGTVHAEQDTTLSPWEYGSSEFMDVGGFSKVENSTTIMNAAERGEVTIPGYPTIGLGAALLKPNGTINKLTLYSARIVVQQSFFGYQYYTVDVGINKSSVSVANMNVVVSPQGITTSYTMTTFTPVFGRFSKGNAERLKEIGQNKLRDDRAQRKRSLKGHLNTIKATDRAYTLLSTMAAGPAYAPNSAGVLLAGKLLQPDRTRKSVIVADKNTFAFYGDYVNTAMMSLDGLLRPVAKTGAPIPNLYRARGSDGLPAMKSYSDMFCPIGTGIVVYELTGAVGSATGSGSGFLGAYSGFPVGTRYQNLYSPAAPPPPMPQLTGVIIAANYLDPLADHVTNPKFMTGMRSTGSLGNRNPYVSGHDIESVARGDLSGLNRSATSGWSGHSMMIAGESGRYTAGTTYTAGPFRGTPSPSGSGDYRFMALKGPLVLQSWGYDTYGKPIPNSKGWSGDAGYDTGIIQELQAADFGNTHQREADGLTDRFAPNWLSDATNWPVAPVDLRYDRIRGVWTTPPPFRLMKLVAINDVLAGETGIGEIITGDDMFNEDGLPFSGIVTIQPTGTGGPGDTGLVTGIAPLISYRPDFDITSGSILISHYDTYSCEHWILGQGGSGGGGGVNGVVPGVGDFVCEGDVITTTSFNMTFSNGLLVSTG